MTINAISDIHASVNLATGEAVYSLPASHSPEELSEIASKLAAASETAFAKQSMWRDAVNWRIDSEKYSSFSSFLEALAKTASTAKSGFAGWDPKDATDFFSALVAAADAAPRLKVKIGKRVKPERRAAFDDVAVLASQLKNDFAKLALAFKPELLEPADYLVVAGDLGTMDSYRAVLADIEKRTAGKFKKVLAIPGNHDYWLVGKDESKLEDQHGSWTRCEHVDGDVVFLGCTLWTPVSEASAPTVSWRMNDYRYIPGCMSSAATSAMFAEQSAWLKAKIAEHAGKKIVVFTHHNPFAELVPEKYRHSVWDAPLNEAYVVSDKSLDDVQTRGNVVLWICGHTHDNFDGELHGIRVVRNPIGYGSLVGYFTPENCSGSWYNKILEI